MVELINKIAKLIAKNRILHLENQRLKDECKRYKEMNDYYCNKYKGNL